MEESFVSIQASSLYLSSILEPRIFLIKIKKKGGKNITGHRCSTREDNCFDFYISFLSSLLTVELFIYTKIQFYTMFEWWLIHICYMMWLEIYVEISNYYIYVVIFDIMHFRDNFSWNLFILSLIERKIIVR